jgi:hypothetical protein
VIVIRNAFQLEFGKAREAVALWKEGMAIAGKSAWKPVSMRVLTDLTGPAYTLVFESTHESLADFESSIGKLFEDPAWREWYAKLVPLCREGAREIFTVVE